MSKKSMEEKLADSFMSLASRKTIDKITIKDITDDAGVIRSTFYNHFQDKYELLEWIIFYRLLGRVDVMVENGMLKEAIIVAGRNILQDKDFYKNAAKLTGQNSFESIVERCIAELFMKFFFKNPHAPNARNPWITPERIAGYYAHGMTYIFLMWIAADMVVPPEEMAQVYVYIEDRSLLDALRELGVDPSTVGQQ
ncbi:MAG: TetR/AcrR family transcriptional regulator C-terminal domain-containing protein [Lachnospiraceae bacterium]|nr:TetR/AcrR family transcriptional regulator C-terminal domain-containing protein [Candidatus Colinaster equi]